MKPEENSPEQLVRLRSALWRAGKPTRTVALKLESLVRANWETNLVRKTRKSMERNGLRYALREIKYKIFYANSDRLIAEQALFSEAELAEQRAARFPAPVRFSLIVPLSGMQQIFVKELLLSVTRQTYGDWELCFLCGDDATRDAIEDIVRESFEAYRARITFCRTASEAKDTQEAGLPAVTAGDYLVFLQAGDLLHPAALFELRNAILEDDADLLYTDENVFRHLPEDAFAPQLKPGYAPDTLRGHNIIGPFTALRRSLLEDEGLARAAAGGRATLDVVLRATELARRITHIPEMLYLRRAGAAFDGSTPRVTTEETATDLNALRQHLDRLGLRGSAEPALPGSPYYRIRYELEGTPKISILIPNYEHLEDLRQCLDSIFRRTSYSNYEIVVVENNSTSPELFAYYEQVQQERTHVRVVKRDGKFNYSAVNNFGAAFCTGEYLLLLNNDIEVISPDWLQEMLMFCQRGDIGAVGAKLIYPDETVQHGGVTLGSGGVAGHRHMYYPRDDAGYMGQLLYAQDLAAVTGACMMVRRDVWDRVHGLDEQFAIAFNDVDLCMRIRREGYRVVWTPFAELYHYESKSRGPEDTPEKQARFNSEIKQFQERWQEELNHGDLHYNPNFSLDRDNFTVAPILKQQHARTWSRDGHATFNL